MNALDTLKQILGVGASRVSGRVTRLGTSVTISTSQGVIVAPMPNVGSLSIGDTVIIESNQITHNLGRSGGIPVYDI